MSQQNTGRNVTNIRRDSSRSQRIADISAEKNVDASQEETIDLGEVFRVIWQHIIEIIASAVIVAVIALAITNFLITPKYQSGFTAFVNNRSTQDNSTTSVQSGDVSAAQSLTYTYASIMTSRPVIEDALKASGLEKKSEDSDKGYTYNDVKDAISTNIEDNTQLVALTVTLTSPKDAYNLAKAIADTAPDYIAQVVEGTSMKVVSQATLPTSQSSPNPAKNTIIGALIGALVMIVYVVVRALADTRIHSSQELEKKFNIPVIGTIPNYDTASRKRGKYGNYGYGYYYKKSSSSQGTKK